MSKEKTEPKSPDRYDTLRMDNLAYMNMPEQEEYLNPIHSGAATGSAKGSPSPDSKLKGSAAEKEPRALPDTPPPPKRDLKLCGKSSEENIPGVLKNASSTRYPRMGNGFTSLERNAGKEKVILKQKNSAFDSEGTEETEMAFGKKVNMKGLRVQTERRDSRSYLLSPELSRRPTQFAVSPTFSYVEEFGSLRLNNNNRNKYVGMNTTWQTSSASSLAPMLPSRSPREPAWKCSPQNNFRGVGDLEHIHIDGMNQNKNYDYADYGHQYEELPNRKSIAKCPMDSGIDSRSEHYQSSGGATDIVSDTEDTANIVNHRNEKRKRVNPLYDAMTQSMPSIYNKNKSTDEGLQQQVRCLKCALIVFIVLTCAAIAVSVFAIISHNQTKDDSDPFLTPKVQRLTEDYSKLETLLSSFDDSNDTMKVLMDLIEKVKMLERNMSAQFVSLNQQISASQLNIQNNALDIINTQTNTSSAISFLNTTLQLQLHNISKQEGPRGPQGVANFSHCSYKNETRDSVASDVFPSYTVWQPTEVELESNIAFSAFCTVDGGTKYDLEVHVISPQRVQYRCECSGNVSGQSRRVCTLHYLQCPRYS